MSNLDYKVRLELRHELRALQQRIGITAVYVTHDREEALTLADRIAVIDAGRVVQVGAPEEIFHRPASAFVAGFMGADNAIDVVAARRRRAGRRGGRRRPARARARAFSQRRGALVAAGDAAARADALRARRRRRADGLRRARLSLSRAHRTAPTSGSTRRSASPKGTAAAVVVPRDALLLFPACQPRS